MAWYHGNYFNLRVNFFKNYLKSFFKISFFILLWFIFVGVDTVYCVSFRGMWAPTPELKTIIINGREYLYPITSNIDNVSLAINNFSKSPNNFNCSHIVKFAQKQNNILAPFSPRSYHSHFSYLFAVFDNFGFCMQMTHQRLVGFVELSKEDLFGGENPQYMRQFPHLVDMHQTIPVCYNKNSLILNKSLENYVNWADFQEKTQYFEKIKHSEKIQNFQNNIDRLNHIKKINNDYRNRY